MSIDLQGKIELKPPFSNDWRKGYLVINRERRRNVVLYNSNTDRSTVSYARYLYEVSLGTYLNKDLQVDHINGDKTDDNLINLQVLTAKENVNKLLKQTNTTKTLVELKCGSCSSIFIRRRNNTHLVQKGIKSTYCSKVCAGRHTNLSIVIREFKDS